MYIPQEKARQHNPPYFGKSELDHRQKRQNHSPDSVAPSPNPTNSSELCYLGNPRRLESHSPPVPCPPLFFFFFLANSVCGSVSCPCSTGRTNHDCGKPRENLSHFNTFGVGGLLGPVRPHKEVDESLPVSPSGAVVSNVSVGAWSSLLLRFRL